MNKCFKNEEIDRINLVESGIVSLTWKNNEQDLEFIIDWCGQENLKNEFDFNSISTKLEFKFVTDLKLSIDYGSKMGAIEISAFSFKKGQDVYEIDFRFDFNPVGFMKFYCNSLDFIIQEI